MRRVFVYAGAALRRRWKKSALVFLALAAGVAAVTATLGLAQTNAAAVLDRLSASEVQRVKATYERVPGADWNGIPEGPLFEGVQAAGLFTPVVSTQNEPVVISAATSEDVLTTTSLVVATPAGMLAHGMTLRSGVLPNKSALSLDPDQIVVGSAVARDANLHGGPLQHVGLNGRSATVVAVVDDSGDELIASVTVLVSPSLARSLGVLPEHPVLEVRTQRGHDRSVVESLPTALSPSDPQLVSVSAPARAAHLRGDLASTTSSLVLSIASVTLLASCLGIASSMMAAVYERRSEIGIQRAMGATRSRIGQQFMVESVLLGTAGGVVGWMAGIVVSATAAVFAGHEHVLPSVVMAVPAVGAFAGIVGGVAPAIAATRVEPSDLLTSL